MKTTLCYKTYLWCMDCVTSLCTARLGWHESLDHQRVMSHWRRVMSHNGVMSHHGVMSHWRVMSHIGVMSHHGVMSHCVWLMSHCERVMSHCVQVETRVQQVSHVLDTTNSVTSSPLDRPCSVSSLELLQSPPSRGSVDADDLVHHSCLSVLSSAAETVGYHNVQAYHYHQQAVPEHVRQQTLTVRLCINTKCIRR